MRNNWKFFLKNVFLEWMDIKWTLFFWQSVFLIVFFYKYHCLNVTIFYILRMRILQITSGDMPNLVNALEEILSIQTMVL